MHFAFGQKSTSSRLPVSPFSKVAAVALLIIGIFWVALAIFVPGNISLLVGAITILSTAALIASGIRWTPLLGCLLCSLALYIFIFQSSFPLYHLAHPKDAYGTVNSQWLAYLFFVAIVILFWCILVTIGAGIAAVIQNYGRRSTPRWFSSLLTGLLGVLVGAILIGAFAPASTQATASSNTGGEATIHLGISSFGQNTISISKGSKLQLIDDGTFEHNISSGRWVKGQPQAEQQSGAPQVSHVVLKNAGQKLEIGPFNTAGTYHLYCSIHTGMTLTIIVQ